MGGSVPRRQRLHSTSVGRRRGRLDCCKSIWLVRATFTSVDAGSEARPEMPDSEEPRMQAEMKRMSADFGNGIANGVKEWNGFGLSEILKCIVVGRVTQAPKHCQLGRVSP